MSEILVLYFSRFGATEKMAQLAARGVESIHGMQAKLRTVPSVAPVGDTPTDVQATPGAPFCTLDDLRHASGLIMGSPTRFGNMAAPLKHFIDSTSGLWLSGGLAGKPAAVFTSTSSMHGGQETTLLSMMLPLFHQGLILVGIPYTEPSLISTATGGTPYGGSHLAGPTSQNPISEDEKNLMIALGQRVAMIAKKLTDL